MKLLKAFLLVIYICCPFINDEDFSFAQHSSCQAKQLSLTNTEVLSLFSNLAIQTARQILYLLCQANLLIKRCQFQSIYIYL